MSMLAEPKRKVKWSLNPRGALWSNDENKFGQKLMEKMGWQKGKGLGKGQDGMHDPLRVSLKSDMKGVGFKEKGEAGVDHFEAFEDVLTNLNKLNNPEAAQDNGSPSSTNEKVDANKKSRSLESKSKGSKARVHYHKFTRGKDLSQYKEDDLACILGSKMSKIRKEKEKVEADELEDKSPPEEVDTEIGRVDTSYGLTTHYGGNFKDYFAKKMLEMKQKRTEGIIGGGSSCTDGTESGMNDSSFPDFDFDPERSTFSFNVTAEVVEEVAEAKEITSDNLNVVRKVSKSKKNKKKKKKEADEENENEWIEWKNKRERKKMKKEMKRKLIAQQALESEKENEYLNLKENEAKESEPTEGKNKKKSKRREDEVVETEIASKKKSKRKENEIESEVIDVQKGKSKRKNYENEESEEVTHKKKSKRKEENVDVCEVPEVKKKKSKKREDKAVEEIEVPEEINPKKKKSKVKKDEEVVSTEVVVEENNKRKKIKLKMELVNIENNEDEIICKKKKKSKHCIQEVELTVEESNQNEVNEKKKRKRNEKVIERIENDENELTEMCVEPIKEMNESYCTANSYDEEYMSDKKKKRRKEKEENEETTKEDKSLQPFKKLKKFTSDLNLFKSNSNLENEVIKKENEDQSDQISKPKLSAMNSFKMLKSDIEDKLKFKKIKKAKSKLKIVEEISVDGSDPSEGPPTGVDESIFHKKEIVTLSIPYKGVASKVTVDLQELFPGSNLFDVGPYETCFN